MTCRHATKLFAASLLLLTVTGCLIEERPYAYRTYPVGVYTPPPPVTPPVAQPAAPPPGTPPVPSQEQPEVLTRGPVHEAFAQPVSVQNQPGMIVASQPPASIAETPPADRPAGDACIWAPGYWSWDSERNNFIWVSGCWRLAPPNKTWVPGYWTHVPNGWQWVPGFWSPVGAQEIVYLPAPPAVTDIQPPGPPPTPDDVWVPGCWYWYQSRYVFRAGYWLRQQPGWIWTPSHCIWTPRGYVFVDGNWDYTLERRGVLFAPVCFPRRVYAGVAFSFSPSITVDIGVLSASLFACPSYEHYYFGDYYDDAYVQVGIYPWFDCVRIGTWYDPVFVYARWNHGRNDPRWEEHERHEFTLRHDDRNLRPPRTYRDQEDRVARLPEPQRHDQQMARPFNTVVAAPSAPMKFERVDTDARRKIAKQSDDTHAFRDARSRWETAAPARMNPAPANQPPGTTTRSKAAPSATTRETAPAAIRPDRVRIQAPFAVEQTDAPRGGDRSTPNRSSDERQHGRGND